MALNESRDSLTAIIARQKLSEEKAETLRAYISKNEGYALMALDKADDNLAMEVAEKIALLLERPKANELVKTLINQIRALKPKSYQLSLHICS